MNASRAQLVREVIRPALQAGEIVLCDRFYDSTVAYQGYGRGLDLQYIQQLDKMIVGDIYPQLTFLLDVPVELGLKRAEKRGQKDRIEQEKVEFFTRVREGYLERAKRDPDRIKIIDASKTPAVAAEQMVALLAKLL